MASSSKINLCPCSSSLTLAIYLVSLVFMLGTMTAATAASLNMTAKVCAQTINPTTCIEILNDDSRTASDPDLLTIATVSTNLSQINATDTQNYIATLLKSVTAPTAQIIHLNACSLSFQVIVPNLNQISNIIQGHDFKRAPQLATDAMNGLADCENGFSSPPAARSPLTDRNTNLEYLIDIVFAATTLMNSP